MLLMHHKDNIAWIGMQWVGHLLHMLCICLLGSHPSWAHLLTYNVEWHPTHWWDNLHAEIDCTQLCGVDHKAPSHTYIPEPVIPAAPILDPFVVN